jgi:lipid-A-disaccharide synthase
MGSTDILISAGDLSGEMHAARLAEELRRLTGARLFGMGGPEMAAAGVELVADYRQVSVVGLTEVLRRLPDILRARRSVERAVRQRQPPLAVLVDTPGFHFGLARRLKRRGVRCVYYIAPQIWAWRKGRLEWLRERFERVLCIFPFEEKYYREAGIRADFVGHPLVDSLAPRISREEFLGRNALLADRPLVALLPGSRASEVALHLGEMLEACALIRRGGPCQFVVAAAPGLPKRVFNRAFGADVGVKVVFGETREALAASDAAIVTSGTATLEAGLLGVPMVVVYRFSPPSAFFLRRMVKIPFFGMVNLILERRAVTELFQEQFTARTVAREIRRLLDSAPERERVRRDLAELRQRLGPGGAAARAAAILAGMLTPEKQPGGR